MTSENGPGRRRKALINSLIFLALVLVGLVLFFVFGRRPISLLEASLLGF